MKTITRILQFAALAFALTATGWAQATLRSTTLSAAVATTDTIINVASATGITVGMYAWVVGSKEAMVVTSISGTALTVRRGQQGTQVNGHANAATIYIDLPQYFKNGRNEDKAGTCTSTSEVVLPVINLFTGNSFQCTASLWVITNGPASTNTGLTALAPNAAGTVDSASATLPWRYEYLAGDSGTPGTNNFKVTGTATAARVITLPDTTDTLVGKATTDTLTNKTYTVPASVAGGAKMNHAAGTAPTTTVAGDVWNDSTQKTIAYAPVATATVFTSGVLYANATPVTATNPSVIADLKTAGALPAGVLNAAGKVLRICGGGTYTTAAAQTPTLTITYALSTIAPLAIVTAATTASATTMPWNSCATITTVTAGVTGTVESGGYLMATLGVTAAAAAAVYQGTNTAVSAAWDQTATAVAKMRATFSSADAGNSVVQRWMTVELLN